MKKLFALAALAATAFAFPAHADWTLQENTNPFNSGVTKVWTTTISSPTVDTSPLTLSSRGCITVDHVTGEASRTITVKVAPLLTGGISTTGVTGVTPTANLGVHTTVAGQARRLWINAAYNSTTSTTIQTSATVTEVQNCTR